VRVRREPQFRRRTKQQQQKGREEEREKRQICWTHLDHGHTVEEVAFQWSAGALLRLCESGKDTQQ
jgi:hypothetical protein